jgi:hypothetical protein
MLHSAYAKGTGCEKNFSKAVVIVNKNKTRKK